MGRRIIKQHPSVDEMKLVVNHGPIIDTTTLFEKKRTFFWLDGKCQVLNGNSVADALQSFGYSAGALHALDFVVSGDCHDYVWINQCWVLKSEAHRVIS